MDDTPIRPSPIRARRRRARKKKGMPKKNVRRPSSLGAHARRARGVVLEAQRGQRRAVVQDCAVALERVERAGQRRLENFGEAGVPPRAQDHFLLARFFFRGVPTAHRRGAGSDRRAASERSRSDASLGTFRSARVLGGRRRRAPRCCKKKALGR